SPRRPRQRRRHRHRRGTPGDDRRGIRLCRLCLVHPIAARTILVPRMPAQQENNPSEEVARRIDEARHSGATQLDLSKLRLTVIPDSLAQLAHLQTLDLSFNQITAIPDYLAQQVAQLQSLKLYNNRITAIPDSLTGFAQLQNLELDYNQIHTIPASLAQCAQLQRLDLDHNQITAIPDSFASLENLTHLFLHGNPSLGIPPEVLGPTFSEAFGSEEKPRKAAKEILAYYFAQRAGAKPLNEAKLILVGRGDVGKTSLVKTLITGKFNKREEPTEGIKISDWPCPLNPTEKVTLHIWDFGGQEMMHATHQFFLTARTLYLLVLERRRDGCDEEADYWFRLIRTFGGADAPVVIVLNTQKLAPFDVNRGAWLEKYAGNIKAFVETDCADPKSISRLKETIQEQLSAVESLKTRFPT